MTQPTVGSVGQDLYDAVTPLAYADADLGWHLLYFCQAIGLLIQQVETYARDTDDGKPGWSLLLDVDRCPPEALGFLAQFVGVSLVPNATDAASRTRIRNTDGFKRGQPGAIVAAAQEQLTGAKTVRLRERHDPGNPDVDSPYHFLVKTYTSETPDASLVQAAVLAQKPAGLIAHFSVVTGQTWGDAAATHTTWADAATAYGTWGNAADG